MAPNQRKPGSRQHNVWLTDDLWAAAQARAAEEGTSVSDVIRSALEQYVTSTDRKPQP